MKYVAFLDILGFKDKLKSLKQNEAKQYIIRFSSTAFHVWNNYNPKHLKGYIVSDSFIIYSDGPSEQALCELVGVIEEICKCEFSQNSVLIRGAVAKGEFDTIEARELSSLSKGLIVGQAYVDAYLLEGKIKFTGIALTEEVYQDLVNDGGSIQNIFIEKIDGTDCYILRYISLDYLLEIDNLQKFIRIANKAKWLPHYYNTLYFSMKRESDDKKVQQVFSNILEVINTKTPSENWRSVDTFIRNAFNSQVIAEFQTRFLKYIRNKLD